MVPLWVLLTAGTRGEVLGFVWWVSEWEQEKVAMWKEPELVAGTGSSMRAAKWVECWAKGRAQQKDQRSEMWKAKVSADCLG